MHCYSPPTHESLRSPTIVPIAEFITDPASPLVAAAIHDGDFVRDDVRRLLALSPTERLREQDPYTADWASAAPTRIIGRRSRFEVDLNRPREKAVYLTPEDAWGLGVWKEPLPTEVVAQSLELYDEFYAAVGQALTSLLERYPRVVVYDLHTYNHRRAGPTGPPADPELNPEVNVGTGTMDRRRWAPVVDRFLAELAGHDFLGRRLDVRENVKFFGGNFARWIHEHFPETVCVLAIEWKKFFMDEWTGQVDAGQSEAIRAALAATVPGVLAELERL